MGTGNENLTLRMLIVCDKCNTVFAITKPEYVYQWPNDYKCANAKCDNILKNKILQIMADNLKRDMQEMRF